MHYLRKKSKVSTFLKLRKTCKEMFLRRRECFAGSLYFGQHRKPLAFNKKSDVFFRSYPKNEKRFPPYLVYLHGLTMKVYDGRVFERIRHHKLMHVNLPQCTITWSEFNILCKPQTIKYWNLAEVTILNAEQDIIDLATFLTCIGKARHVL